MSIDMPPPMQPMQISQTQLEKISSQYPSPYIAGSIKGIKINVLSLPYIAKEDVITLLDRAETPSQFIISLNTAYYLKGHLLIKIAYRQQGDTVFVYAAQTRLKSVQGPKSITKYFNDLVNDEDLMIAEVDRRRVLANVTANRQVSHYSVSYLVDDNIQETDLLLTARDSDGDQNQLSLSLNNEGNRYVGSYLGSAEWRSWFDNGGELKLAYLRAIPRGDEKKEGNRYNAFLVGYNYPSRFGLYGVDAMVSGYSRLVTESVDNPNFFNQCQSLFNPLCSPFQSNSQSTQVLLDIDATTTKYTLAGEQIAYSRPGRRLIINESIERIADEIEDSQQGVILDESYGVIGLGLKYIVSSASSQHKNMAQLQLQLKSGLGSDSGTLSTVNDDSVSIGKHSADFLLLKPSITAQLNLFNNFQLQFSGNAQLSNDTQVPQFQQYTLGGITQLSGFLPGVLVGDSGSYAKVEILMKPTRETGFRLIPSIFIESGKTSSEDTTSELSKEKSLSDAGVRLQLYFGEHFQMEVVSAKLVSDSNLSQRHIDEYSMDLFAKMKIMF